MLAGDGEDLRPLVALLVIGNEDANKHWIKIKNPAHPAYSRVRDQLLAAPFRIS